MAARVVLSLDEEIVREVELTRPVTVVGRHPDCDIAIEHPAISGRHMLFRVVNRTVYVEDLASTNGTKVNGIPTAHQVVHHLDMIEVGRHKIHFFDDALMAGGVASLESTVHTDYERTMLAAHVPAAAHATNDADLSRTMAIQRDPTVRLGGGEGGTAVAQAPNGVLALRVLSGERAGQTIALDRANTMIGTAGGDSALVVRRGQGLFLARFGGNRPPRLNRRPLDAGTHPIGPHDLIEVGGSSFEVIQAAG